MDGQDTVSARHGKPGPYHGANSSVLGNAGGRYRMAVIMNHIRSWN